MDLCITQILGICRGDLRHLPAVFQIGAQDVANVGTGLFICKHFLRQHYIEGRAAHALGKRELGDRVEECCHAAVICTWTRPDAVAERFACKATVGQCARVLAVGNASLQKGACTGKDVAAYRVILSDLAPEPVENRHRHFVRFGAVVAEFREAEHHLPLLLVACKISVQCCHQSFTSQNLFVVDQSLDGIERIADRRRAAGLHHAVIVERTARVVRDAAFETPFGQKGLYELCIVCRADLLSEIAEGHKVTHKEADLCGIRLPKLIEGLKVAEVTRFRSELNAAARLAVTQGKFKQLGKVHRAVLTAEIALAGDLNLLTAEHCVVSCMRERNADGGQPLNNVFIADHGRVAHALRPHFCDQIGQVIGRAFVEANRHSRVCIVQTAQNLEHQEGQLVCHIPAVSVHTSDRDVMYAVFQHFQHQRTQGILGRNHVAFLARTEVKREEILIRTSDAVHPVPQAVEPHKLGRLIQGARRAVRHT